MTDNRAVAPSDFTEFSVTAPHDPRLPGGGGYVVSGLYNVNPDKFSAVDNYRTYAPAYGNVSQVYNGVDFNVSARLRGGLQVQGGTSTGQQVIDSCDVRDKLPEQVSGGASSQGGIPYNPLNPYCHVAPGMTTRATAAGCTSCRGPTCNSGLRSPAARVCHCRPTGWSRARWRPFPLDALFRGTRPTSR